MKNVVDTFFLNGQKFNNIKEIKQWVSKEKMTEW